MKVDGIEVNFGFVSEKDGSVVRDNFLKRNVCTYNKDEKQEKKRLVESGEWGILRERYDILHSKELNETIFETNFHLHPAVQAMSQRDRDIMELRYLGLGYERIGKNLNIPKSTVASIVKRIDPKGLLKPDKEMRQKIRTQMADQAFSESMMIIMENLSKCTAPQAMRIAKQCHEIIQNENQSKHEAAKESMDSILDSIEKAEIVSEESPLD